jgi:hypothetical protein
VHVADVEADQHPRIDGQTDHRKLTSRATPDRGAEGLGSRPRVPRCRN